ncbi:sodium-dependent phosphate transport protein 2B [Hyalella azteca]|uniref:Sodium-dependent phosphate transport protein 2B n=1 Tax=Hyalella azteca TaxID=294128 RepID=A0A979FIQ4_HYAAZ|nr:sodium-dependent phosphate transport protein 2B [Hyalella azteca]
MRKNSAVYPANNGQNGQLAVVGESNLGFYGGSGEVQLSARPSSNYPTTLTVSPQEEQPHDPWAIAPLQETQDSSAWKHLPVGRKMLSVCVVMMKLVMVFGLLYFFICSLNFLSTSFRLLAGKTTGAVLQNKYINNPIVGLMIGIMVTVLVQSSSTSTSIIVSMVNSGILKVPAAVPMIMGSNVGTSVTNTIVSLTQMGDRDVFRRAFAGATVHDMFNWLAVLVLLTVEIISGKLRCLCTGLVTNDWSKIAGGDVKLLNVITDPFTKTIIQLERKVLEGWSNNNPSYDNVSSLLKHGCLKDVNKRSIPGSCGYVFEGTTMSDTVVGIILLMASLLVLCVALVLIVKILSSIMKGLGLITVDRSYPLTLGSNIGTTTTALLAAVAGTGAGIKNSIQIALVHLFFNIFGIIMFYPIPFTRLPIVLAKGLGNITAKYRWFAVLYLIFTFFLMPGFVFVLSLGGNIVLYCVGIPILVLIATIILINILQTKAPKFLPNKLRSWVFLPAPLRSLEPYDKVMSRLPCCASCHNDQVPPPNVVVVNPSSDITSYKNENGEVLVEPRAFFPVGPIGTSDKPNGNAPEKPMTPQYDGIVNPGIDVERL